MEFSPARNRQHPNHGRKIILIVVGLFLILIAAAIVFWATADNKGVVVETPDQTDDRGPAIKDLRGKYVSLSYSGVYDLKKSALGDGDLEAYMLTASTNYEKHLAINVARPLGGSLDNFSPYIARKTRPDMYVRQDTVVAGEAAVVFVKNDLTERTIFLVHDGIIATLSFVSQGASEDLQPEIDKLLATFKWKQ